MHDTIILFTPTHTGTHFVRMLLEAHPAISTAIGEDYRIDAQFRPDYLLTGRGAGRDDPPLDPRQDASSERMLLTYLHEYLTGTSTKTDFQNALAYWRGLTSERKRPLTNAAHHLRAVREEFRSLGIHLAPKQERYLLYRGHCHGEHAAYDLARLTRAFRVIVTVRHPLLSILTTLRRNPVADHEPFIESFITALRCIFALDGAFVFCTDLWQAQPARMAQVFAFLQLSLSPAAEQYLALRPRVNYTVAPHDDHGLHNYCVEFEHAPAFLATLREAKALLEQDRCHPLLQPYWARLREIGLLPHFERLGYRTGLALG